MKAEIYKDEDYKLMGAALQVYNEQGYGLAERPQPGGLWLETASRAALMFGVWSFFGIWDLAF